MFWCCRRCWSAGCSKNLVYVEVHHRDVESDDDLFNDRRSPSHIRLWRVTDGFGRSDSLSRHSSAESLTVMTVGGDAVADARCRGHTPGTVLKTSRDDPGAVFEAFLARHQQHIGNSDTVSHSESSDQQSDNGCFGHHV